MSRYRFHKVFLLWVALGIVFPGAALLNASDRIPRKWTEMTMDYIDPFPFSWAPGRGSICKITNFFGDRYDGCYLELRAPAPWNSRGYEELRLWVQWSLADEWPGQCKAYFCENSGKEGEYEVKAKDRVIIVKAEPIGGTPVYRASALESHRKAFPSDEAKRIMRDVVMTLEPYATPCNCAGQPVRPTGETPPRPRATPPASPGGNNLPPEAEVPPSTIDTPPHLLGQGEGEPGTTSSESRAMRRTSGGFPPGVEVSPLRIYPSAKGPLPQDTRSYGNRFDDRVAYVMFGVDLTYPPRTEPFPFELELVVLKDGQPHVKYTRGGYSLGWTKSWHEIGWGRASGGLWPPGSYRAELSVKGQVVATGTFQIVPSER